jgi:hypothetical protein
VLNTLSPEGHHHIYKMLRLTVEVSPESSLDVTGILGNSCVSENQGERVGLAQVRVKFALPEAPGGDALVGVEEEEQRAESFAALSLSEVLGGVPVATVVRDERRGNLFSLPLVRPEVSCLFHGAGKKKAGLVPSSSVEDVQGAEPHPLPPLLSLLGRRLVVPPLLGTPATSSLGGPRICGHRLFGGFAFSQRTGCAYESSEKQGPMNSRCILRVYVFLNLHGNLLRGRRKCPRTPLLLV